jgi:hypothetical protein
MYAAPRQLDAEARRRNADRHLIETHPEFAERADAHIACQQKKCTHREGVPLRDANCREGEVRQAQYGLSAGPTIS